MRILRFVLVGILVSLALAACGTGETITAEQIMDGIERTREQTRDAHAVVEVSTTGTTDRDGQFVVETWMRKSDRTDAAGKPIPQSHVKVLEASKDEVAGAELVNDGETIWIYNPKENTVITGKLSDLKEGHVGAQDPTAKMLRMEEMIQQVLDGSDVEILADNEPVAGMDAWKVKLTPKPETTAQMQLGSAIETTLWVQHATYVPLQIQVKASEKGSFRATV